MLDIPSRASLAALTEAADAVIPTRAIGFVRALGDGRVSVLHWHRYGIIGYALPASSLPDVLRLQQNDVQHAGEETIRAHPDEPSSWQFTITEVRRVVSFALPTIEPSPTRFWVGLRDDEVPTSEQVRALETVAARAAAALETALASQVGEFERLRRLEVVAGLLPTLLTVLDIRDVFDRVSGFSQAALPHDMLTLGLFSDDLSQLTLYAGTGRGSDTGRTFPQPYPKAVTQGFVFDIIDDRAEFPLERERPPTTLGMRSSLRVPIEVTGKAIGGIGFHARARGAYDLADVAVARRLADHVAVAVCHHRLAEEGRRAAALEERTRNLELLDELLAALIDSGDLHDTFERVSAIAGKVLPHDAAGLLVHDADGRRQDAYTSRGFPAAVLAATEVPAELLADPEWEYDIIDDLALPELPQAGLTAAGFASMLRVAIRMEGRSAGALVFLSKAGAAFKPSDILVARRIADRLAVTLARQRIVEASKRADEATARAARLEVRVRALTEELDVRTGYRRVVGESKGWRQALTQAAQVAATDTTVLLLGESGTGKEVVARFLHRGSSRDGGPFVALNCAALPEQLLEAELFGYERGAFTGATQSKPGQLERAAGGTLFLDEVGEMSLPAQAKFLRVLQEREFQRLGGTRVLRTDARIVAATNRDLQRAITHGQFREDLYYRLNVFAIRLPPLRDRREDVLPLSEAFLHEIGRGLGRPPGGISRDARQMLVEYHWPGNVRELRNILERAAILCDGGLITPEHLAVTVAPPPSAASAHAAQVEVTGPAVRPAQPSSAKDLLDIERAMIQQALQSARFNKSKAAKALGMTRHQLYIRMQKYGLV